MLPATIGVGSMVHILQCSWGPYGNVAWDYYHVLQVITIDYLLWLNWSGVVNCYKFANPPPETPMRNVFLTPLEKRGETGGSSFVSSPGTCRWRAAWNRLRVQRGLVSWSHVQGLMTGNGAVAPLLNPLGQ